MNITSSYQVRIVNCSVNLNDTVRVYREALSYLIGIVNENWDALTPPTIEIVGFLGDAARFIAKPCLKQRVMRFPTIRYGCSAQ